MYPFKNITPTNGFDYSDLINFTPVFLNGLNNKYNYCGRKLFVDSSNTLYIGTANPFQGCEVWKVGYKSNDNHCHSRSINYSCLLSIQKEINNNFEILNNYIQTLLKSIPKETYHNFF